MPSESTTYVALLRGINVGGKNRISMAQLKKCLEEQGLTNVSTYIASGNLAFRSKKRAAEIESLIEEALPKAFELDSQHIKVLVLSQKQLRAIIDNRPNGFGEQPKKYHCDAIFLMGIDSARAMSVFSPRTGVDKIWVGNGVIYSQRLSAQRTRSRLSRIIGTPAYASMTIRSWTTTMKLLELMKDKDKSVSRRT